MENKENDFKKYKKTDLKLFRDQLEKEKEHLKELYKFSNGVEHSGTMDCKKEIKRLETIVEYLETAQEVPVQEQYVGKCEDCNKINEIQLLVGREPKFCMECGEPILYQKIQ